MLPLVAPKYGHCPISVFAASFVLGLGYLGRVLGEELPLAVPGEVGVVLVVVEVVVVVDHVGGRGVFSLEAWETWEDDEAVEDEDIGGSSGWAASRGPGPLTR